MNPSYRRDKDHNYMILEAPGTVTGTEFQVRMLILNRIPGLLPCKMRRIDGETGFYYEITSLQPMARIFETKRMGREDIRQLLLGVEKAMDGAREFLLDPNQLLLDPDYIYMDIETREVSLCCLPTYEGDAAEAFRGLAEYILKNLDHGDQEAVLWGYEIYSQTTGENYSIQKVLESVHERGGENFGNQSPFVSDSGDEVWKEEMQEAEPDFTEGIQNCEAETDHSDQQAGNSRSSYAGDNETYRQTIEQEQIEREERAERSASLRRVFLKALLLAGGILAIGGITWAGYQFADLTEIQSGGIFFLGAGIFVYFTSIWKGLPKKEKVPRLPPGYEAEELLTEDEEGPEQPGHQNHTKMWEENTEVDSEEEFGATTLLRANYAGDYAVLVSMEPGQRENIVLDHDVLMIGKMAGQADIVLNQPVISRLHAKLERREEGYFLTDLNSTNGTYVNGTRLEAFECRKLHTADEVYFASLGYYFKE